MAIKPNEAHMSDPQLHNLIQERVKFITNYLQLDEDVIISKFPHLSKAEPYQFGQHLHWVSATPISRTLDHTLLKPEATVEQFDKLCHEAIENEIEYICVPPGKVENCLDKVKGSPVKVASVLGFPHGNGLSKVRAFEANALLGLGVHELDMVIDVGKLIELDYHGIKKDIQAVAAECGHRGEDRVLKVIMETCLLNQTQVIDACILAVYAGAHYVKTSTGFSTGGATEQVVRLMKLTVGDAALVKASGGVRTYNDALLMLRNGASRIGTSAGAAIVGASKTFLI